MKSITSHPSCPHFILPPKNKPALSRRTRKVDNIASTATLYYRNNQWQVLQEYDATGDTAQRYFVYGNYIDQVLMITDTDSTNSVTDGDYYYAHNHLYSPTALMEADGDVIKEI
ncbi:MAG: hypothetical protein KAJ18_08035 [Candidatus Omnitrophica bacterium]|nr:hypothetical protein [Candidatus Omnitrophota bacterium]